MEYFKPFPKIDYKNFQVIDITRKAKIIETLEQNPFMFLPYTVQNDMKAEEVAFHYYGDPHDVWLIWLANKMIDPYTDWPMSTSQFHNYLMMKYQEKSNQTGFNIILWTQSNIEFYENQDDIRISKTTYDLSPDIDRSEWSPITTYQLEEAINENKRNIRLINFALKDAAIQEFKKVMNAR